MLITEKPIEVGLTPSSSVKMEGALQELDETAYWLELLLELQVVDQSYLNDLLHETDELTAIFVTTVRNVKSRRKP